MSRQTAFVLRKVWFCLGRSSFFRLDSCTTATLDSVHLFTAHVCCTCIQTFLDSILRQQLSTLEFKGYHMSIANTFSRAFSTTCILFYIVCSVFKTLDYNRANEKQSRTVVHLLSFNISYFCKSRVNRSFEER